MNSMGNLRVEFEQEIAELLLSKLSDYEISLDRASQIAKFILEKIPSNISNDDLRKILPQLDQDFVEISRTVLKYMDKLEDIDRNKQSSLLLHMLNNQSPEIEKQLNEYFLKKNNHVK